MLVKLAQVDRHEIWSSRRIPFKNVQNDFEEFFRIWQWAMLISVRGEEEEAKPFAILRETDPTLLSWNNAKMFSLVKLTALTHLINNGR